MRNTRKSLRLSLFAVAFSVLLLVPKMALAHAVLVSSIPAAHGTLQGQDATIDLKFNSRIDGAHSRLYLVAPDGKVQTLKLVPQKNPNELVSESLKLPAGAYTIRWQVLASDGHMTRGVIPFTAQ